MNRQRNFGGPASAYPVSSRRGQNSYRPLEKFGKHGCKSADKKWESDAKEKGVSENEDFENVDDHFMPEITDLADHRFRSELIRMMGSEEIRLNDQEWSRKFEEKLEEDYHRLLDKQVNNLAQAEKQRIHRLRMEGVINDDRKYDDFGAPGSGSDLKLHMSPHSLAHAPPGSLRKKVREKRARPPEELDDIQIFADEESNRRERNLLAHRQEKIYSCEDIQTQLDRIAAEEQQQKGKKVEMDYKQRQMSFPASASLSDNLYGFSSASSSEKFGEEGEKAEQGQKRRKQLKNVPPYIVRLYEEETISGLYQIAAEVLNRDDGEKAKSPESANDDGERAESPESATDDGEKAESPESSNYDSEKAKSVRIA